MSTSKKIQGLGKGLGALLPSLEFSEKGFKFASDEIPEGNLILVDISKIENNPYQPRKDFDPQSLEELSASIIEHGVIQPVTVRKSATGYELIAGERRLKASEAAGLKKIPAYIIDMDSGIQMLEMALVENVQRENLNPIEIASGYQRLIEECSLTQEQVAVKVGKDRSTVTNFLRLLKLPEPVQESLRKKEISMGHARTLLALVQKKKMLEAWKFVLKGDLSVRATEALVRDIETGKIILDADSRHKPEKISKAKKKEEDSFLNSELAAVIKNEEDKLRTIFATQVRIQAKTEDSGSIEIEYYSKEDYERLMDLFSLIRDDN